MVLKKTKQLIEHNKAYHRSIVNRLDNPKKKKIAERNREKYFQKLIKNPGFKRLFKGKKEIYLKIGNKSKKYTLFLTGLKSLKFFDTQTFRANINCEITMFLDDLGRLRTFGRDKIFSSKWFELRGFEKKGFLKNKLEGRISLVSPSQKEELEEINAMLNSHYDKINFEKHSSRTFLKLLKFL
jgi:hypothetical protein